MSSILDIDLDHLNLLEDPAGELDRLIRWARRPVDAVGQTPCPAGPSEAKCIESESDPPNP